MNRAELIEWLRTYTPFELEFRKLYEIYNTDIPDTEFLRVVDKYGTENNRTGEESFRNIDAAVPAFFQRVQRAVSSHRVPYLM